MTVAIAGSPKSYAASLLKLATLRGRSRVLEAAPAALTSSCLRARVVRIVSSGTSIAPIWARSIAAAIVALLAVTSMGVAGLTLVATVFATPFVPRIPSGQATARQPASLPMSPSNGAARRSAGRPVGQSSPARPSTREPSSPAPHPATAPAPQPTPPAASVVEPPRAAGVSTDPDREIVAPLPSIALTAAGQPAATAGTPSSPWAAMAAGGTAIGRKSKDAGGATAGFFTRFAKHVAGSF
jgi:hypothetical protein